MSHPDTLILLQALSDTWLDLPGLVGVDWPLLETGLTDLLERLRAERDPDQEDLLRWQVMVQLRPYPAALDHVQRRMDKLTFGDGEAFSKGLFRPEEGPSATTQSESTGPVGAVTRYTDIQLPARVQVERRFSLIVGLTITPSPDSADAQPVQAGVGQIVRVVVSPAGAAAAPYPDLVLRITTEGNQLHYDLHFADVRYVSVPGERLRTNPETFRYELIREIEQMAMDAGKKGSSTAKIKRQLAKTGQRLYKELFSADLRREYRSFSRQITTLQIISAEPWIPWELIKPYDDEGDEIIDHDYLCMQFEFARWFTPARAPAARIEVDSLACVAPGDSKLVEAQGEKDDLHRLAQELRLLDLTLAHATYEAIVQTLLEGDTPIRLWHFACHGGFENEAPGKSPLILEGRQPFTPDDILGRAQTRLKRDQPFVFLNACRVGQSGLALTGMGGWAKVLIQDCGVGSFLAPVWEVDDVQARRFAATFYDFIRRTPKCTVAQAVREARSVLRELPEHDPTWLAYGLYAHPNARIVL